MNPRSTEQLERLGRLDRLERYLAQDPNNVVLLADAFEVALQSGAWDRAEFHLRHGEALGLDRHEWALRRGHWLLGQHRYDEARGHLAPLRDDPDVPEALRRAAAHDTSYAALRAGDAAAGARELEAWLAREPLEPAMQVLWLRLLHRCLRLDDAVAWARERVGRVTLAPAAAGVASLAALDAGDHAASLQWAQQALQQEPSQMEALVARACLALAEQDPATARRLLEEAVRHNPDDGRAWSALGFTALLEQRLDVARGHFERALATMPDHIGTWHGLGWTGVLQRDLALAQRAFESALALDRNFAESHGGLAVVLVMQGREHAARDAIERAVRLDRSNLSAQYARALLDGEARDAASLHRLASRLLGGRAPLRRP